VWACGLERERCRSAVAVARREAVEQRRVRRVRVDVSNRQVGRRENEGHGVVAGPSEDDAAVVAEGARELREEGERGGERVLEDVERVEGDRVGRVEADRAERDVEHVAVGVETGQRQRRRRRLLCRGELDAFQDPQLLGRWLHTDGRHPAAPLSLLEGGAKNFTRV
jgi:hypothetical protein